MTVEFNILPETVSELAKVVKEISGQDVNVCYQCKKCTAGCPIAYAMDYTPIQLIHAIGLGLEDLVFRSKTVWLCATCETCTTRCPQELDIARVMNAVKIIAMRRRIKSAVPSVYSFYKAALRSARIFGRTFEPGLVLEHKFRTRQFLKDIGLGMKLFTKGKFKIWPDINIIGAYKIRKIFSKTREKERRKAQC
jgi:heterodisulfide reductase subunit C